MEPPIPALALADTILFADTMPQVLQLLAQYSGRWTDAIVLATPFWAPVTGRLNQPIHFSVGMSPLIEASLRFDPDRELYIGSIATDIVSGHVKWILSQATRLRLHSSVSLDLNANLVDLIPNVTALHLVSHEQLHYFLQKPSFLSTLQELKIDRCPDWEDLSDLRQMKVLRKLTVDGCEELYFLDDLKYLTKLEELRFGGLGTVHDETLSALAEPKSLWSKDVLSSTNMWMFEHGNAEELPLKLLPTCFALLRSQKKYERVRGSRMITEIFSVNRDPWGSENDRWSLVPVDMVSTYVAMLRSACTEEVARGMDMLHAALYRLHGPPVEVVVEEGCVAACSALLLRDGHPDLQADAARLLTKVATLLDPRKNAFSPDVVRNVIRLIRSPDEECQTSALSVIAEIGSRNASVRKMLIDFGVIDALNSARYSFRGSGESAAAAVASLSYSNEPLGQEHAAGIIPVIAQLLGHPECLPSVLEALSYLSDGGVDRIQPIVNDRYSFQINDFLRMHTVEVSRGALKILRNIVANGSDTQIVNVISKRVLVSFSLVLVSRKLGSIGNRVMICEIVATIIKKDNEVLEPAIEALVFKSIVTACRESDVSVQKAGLATILIAVKLSSETQIGKVVGHGVTDYLRQVIDDDASNAEVRLIAEEVVKNAARIEESIS